MDPMLLNGKPRCTLIQRTDRSVVVICPDRTTRKKFGGLIDAEKTVEKLGWVIAISHPTLVRDKDEEVQHGDTVRKASKGGRKAKKKSIYHPRARRPVDLDGSGVAVGEQG